MAEAELVVLDFGSQYTQLIARRARELGVYSVALAGTADAGRVLAHRPRAVILSGGPASVHEEDAPLPDWELLRRCNAERVPVLGICYGMQCLVHLLGGSVRAAQSREYGVASIVASSSRLLARCSAQQQVWMSHGDEVVSLPPSLRSAATSFPGDTVVAVESIDDSEGTAVFGLQYHPEVAHTPEGTETLRAFLFDIAHASGGWSLERALEKQVQAVRGQVGDQSHAICALSGGVDSAVAATLCRKALGDRLHCVFVDNGLLRKDEQQKVVSALQSHLGLQVEIVDGSDETLNALAGVEEPEQKRQVIGRKFVDFFKRFEERTKFESDLISLDYLVQGTLYPDVIESCPPAGAEGRNLSHTIKSHHNVGGLPKDLGFKLVEPLRELFKDEVRQLGSIMGVPSWFLRRHPFPGPGLAVRVLGDVTVGNKLHMCREADKIFIDVLEEEGEYDNTWQAFAAILPVAAVGVQGDQRTRGAAVALRAITSTDGMTADWAPLSHSLLAKASARICNAIEGVNRVFYDVTSKPPSTVELE